MFECIAVLDVQVLPHRLLNLAQFILQTAFIVIPEIEDGDDFLQRTVSLVFILGGLPFFEKKAMKYASMMYVYVCIYI